VGKDENTGECVRVEEDGEERENRGLRD